MNEFELIARYFTRPADAGGALRQGVGDDCASFDAGDRTIVLTTDMLLAGRHFFPDADPRALGHKALAVNLSDLAAAGARPRCFLLALALPRADHDWLAAFSQGLFALADAHGCALAGGDTTRAPKVAGEDGPLTICITAVGEVPIGGAHTRAGARPGDDLWASGELGDAALALAYARGEVTLDAAAAAAARDRFERPQPRLDLGQRLRAVATSCIDISDGLLGDLAHLIERSGVGAEVHWDAVPRSAGLRRQRAAIEQRCALAGGDDYELLFTAPPRTRIAVEAAGQAAGVAVTRIGRMTGSGLVVVDAGGRALDTRAWRGFDHFAP